MYLLKKRTDLYKNECIKEYTVDRQSTPGWGQCLIDIASNRGAAHARFCFRYTRKKANIWHRKVMSQETG